MANIQHNGIVVSLPTGWHDLTQVVVQGPPDGDVRPNLTITRDASRGGESLKAFAARQATFLTQLFPGAKKLCEQETVLGGKRGMLSEQQFTMNGKAVSQLIFATQSTGGGYLLVFSCAAARAAAHRKTAEKLFAETKLGSS